MNIEKCLKIETSRKLKKYKIVINLTEHSAGILNNDVLDRASKRYISCSKYNL